MVLRLAPQQSRKPKQYRLPIALPLSLEMTLPLPPPRTSSRHPPNISASKSKSWPQPNRPWTGTVLSASRHSNLRLYPPQLMRLPQISPPLCHPLCARRLLRGHASASARAMPWTFDPVYCLSVTLEILRKSTIISIRSAKVLRVVYSPHMSTPTTTVWPSSK